MIDAEIHNIRNIFLEKVIPDAENIRIKAGIKMTEDELTAKVLSPLCILDIAYEMWQDIRPEFKHKTRQQYNRIQNMWYNLTYMNSVFGPKGILYAGMTEEQVSLLNDHFEVVRENTDKHLQTFYYAAQRQLMRIDDVHARDVTTKLVMITTMVTFVYTQIDRQYNCHTPLLHDMSTLMTQLINMYCKEKTHNKQFPIEYDSDENFVLALKVFWNSVQMAKIETKQAA